MLRRTRPNSAVVPSIWSSQAVPSAMWRHRDLVDRGLKPGRTAQESAELAAARARIRDLEEEVKILHKAAAAVEAVVRPKNR